MVSGLSLPSTNSFAVIVSQMNVKSSSGMRANRPETMPSITVIVLPMPASARARPLMSGSRPYRLRRYMTARCFSALGMAKRYVTSSWVKVRICAAAWFIRGRPC
ncbi:hypothetical protein D3C81_1798640 [compost metagenome]